LVQLNLDLAGNAATFSASVILGTDRIHAVVLSYRGF